MSETGVWEEPADDGSTRWRYHYNYASGGSASGFSLTREEAERELEEVKEHVREHWAHMINYRANGDVDKNGNRVFRADGWHFIAMKPANNTSNMRGYGGRPFRFRDLYTGEVYDSNDVWSQGKIPEEFLDSLPDNAVILSLGMADQ